MKKILLTFLFCMVGFSSLSDEVLYCRAKTVGTSNKLLVNTYDEKSIAMMIDFEKNEIVIKDSSSLSGFYKINEINDRLIEAVRCDSFAKLETCGWTTIDDEFNGEKVKVITKQTLVYFRKEEVGTLFFSNNLLGSEITKLSCN